MINIKSFGQIADITGSELTVKAANTTALKAVLVTQFPELEHKKYAIAINKKLVEGQVLLNDNDEVALMPPYSGG